MKTSKMHRDLDKVIKTIKSCTSNDHFEPCVKLIVNFTKIYLNPFLQYRLLHELNLTFMRLRIKETSK